MMRKLKLLLSVVLFSFVSNQAPAYTIHGQLKGYAPKWKNKVFLAAIRSVNDFEQADERLKINEADIDSLGRFNLQGNNLPDEYTFYRVYVTNTDAPGMQLLEGKDQNFVHLLLNNQSDVTINADLHDQPLYNARIGGSPFAAQFTGFYRSIFYIGNQNYFNSDVQVHLNSKKFVELVKASVAANKNPYYTIFALSHLQWKTLYPADKVFFQNALSGLQKQLPASTYVAELNDRLQLLEFQNSPYKRFLNEGYFFALTSACVILVAIIIFLMFRLNKKHSPKMLDAGPTEQRLTQKELEIANLVVQGKSNKEISALMFIEVSTVKSHIGSIYQKLNISNRHDLADKLNAS